MYFFIKYSSENPSFLDSLPIETFAEETLRLEIPFPYCARNANEDIQIGSKTIKRQPGNLFYFCGKCRPPTIHKSFLYSSAQSQIGTSYFWSRESLLCGCGNYKEIFGYICKIISKGFSGTESFSIKSQLDGYVRFQNAESSDYHQYKSSGDPIISGGEQHC